MSVNREFLKRLGEAVREGRGDEILLLLPTHRLQAEARERFFTETGLAGARRLNILSFYQFVRRILTAAGVRREPVDDALRRFILAHLLRREADAGRLPRFAALAGSDGLAAAFGRLIGEMKLAGVTPDDLAPVAGREVAHVYRVYQDFLAERGLADGEESLVLAREALRREPRLLRGITVLLDGFFDLTPIQAGLLNEAARQARAVEFILPERDPRPELEAVPARVEGLLGKVTVRRLGQVGEAGRAPQLLHLDAELFRLSPAVRPPGDAVRLVPAGSPEAEVRWVAKEIKRLVAGEGAAPADFAVLVADSAAYGPLLAARLAEEGIPTAQEAGEPLDQSPLVRAVLLCLEAALGLQTGFDLLKLVRSGYLPGDEVHLAALRHVFRERGYQFTRTEWERRLDAAELRLARRLAHDGGAPETQRRLEEVQAARGLLPALLDPLAALPRRAPLAEHLGALEDMMRALQFDRAALEPAVPEELRVRDWNALGAFREVLDGLLRAGDLLPEAGEVTLGEFLAVLRAALTEARYRVAAAVPGGVSVMNVSQSRGLTFPYVFFIGLSDGVVPRPAREDWLLPEGMRRELAARGLPVETAADAAARERFLFRTGISRASRRLYLSYPVSDGAGGARLGSAYLSEVQRVFSEPLPGDDTGAASEALFPVRLELVSTTRELALRAGAGDAAAAACLKAREAARWAHLSYASASLMRRSRPVGENAAWDGRILGAAARAELARRRGPGARWSATQFGDYNRCPFRFFVQHELLAPPVDEAAEGLSALEKGVLFHEVLCRYYREAGDAAFTRSPEARAAALHALVKESFDRSPARPLAPHPYLWEAAQEEAEAWLFAALARDAECYAATGFRPRFLEWSFGLGGGRDADPASVAEPLVLEADGERLSLVGKVDRVDVDEAGHFVVYDYKSGKTAPKWKDEAEGRALQLRVYLAAVAGLLPEAGQPVGAGYFLLATQDAREGLWHKEGAAKVNRFHNKRSAGILTPEEWDALMTGTSRLAAQVAAAVRAGEFPLRPDPSQCPNCKFQAACRVDERFEVGEDEA